MKASSLPVTGTSTILPQKAWCGGLRIVDAVVVAQRVRRSTPGSIIAARAADMFEVNRRVVFKPQAIIPDIDFRGNALELVK